MSSWLHPQQPEGHQQQETIDIQQRLAWLWGVLNSHIESFFSGKGVLRSDLNYSSVEENSIVEKNLTESNAATHLVCNGHAKVPLKVYQIKGC
jgi:hypothetical protein